MRVFWVVMHYFTLKIDIRVYVPEVRNGLILYNILKTPLFTKGGVYVTFQSDLLQQFIKTCRILMLVVLYYTRVKLK